MQPTPWRLTGCESTAYSYRRVRNARSDCATPSPSKMNPLAPTPCRAPGLLFSPNAAPNVKLAQSCVHASITLTDAALGTPSVRRQCTPAKRCKFCSFDVGYPLSDLDTESGACVMTLAPHEYRPQCSATVADSSASSRSRERVVGR